MIVPITEKSYGYAQEVRQVLRKAGFYTDADLANNKMQKKVRGDEWARAMRACWEWEVRAVCPSLRAAHVFPCPSHSSSPHFPPPSPPPP